MLSRFLYSGISNMALPANTGVADFLAIAKAGLAKAIQKRSKVTIVTGNQSAGLSHPEFGPTISEAHAYQIWTR